MSYFKKINTLSSDGIVKVEIVLKVIRNLLYRLLNFTRSNNLSSSALRVSITSFLANIFMFVFWITIARFYDSSEVGAAAVALSTASIIVTFASFSIGLAFLRYATQLAEDFGQVLATSMAIITIIAGVTAWIVAISGVARGTSPEVLVILTCLLSVFSIHDLALMSLQKTWVILYRTLLVSLLRLIGAYLLIFISDRQVNPIWAFVMAGGVVTVFTHLYIRLSMKLNMRISFLGFNHIFKLTKFILINHVSNLFSTIAVSSLPIIASHLLSNNEAGKFYISFSIASVVYLIPFNVSTMLLPHAAKGTINRHDTRQLQFLLWIFVLSILLLLPSVSYIMLLFGAQYYQTSGGILRVLMIASIPMTPANLYFSLLRLWRDDFAVVVLSLIYSATVISTALIATLFLGVIGIALGIFIGQVVVLVCSCIHSLYKHHPIDWLWMNVGKSRMLLSSSDV